MVRYRFTRSEYTVHSFLPYGSSRPFVIAPGGSGGFAVSARHQAMASCFEDIRCVSSVFDARGRLVYFNVAQGRTHTLVITIFTRDLDAPPPLP